MLLDSDTALELRMRRRYEAAVRRLGERRWRCPECGEVYDARWVAWNGPRCHAECDHSLVRIEEEGENG